MSRTDWPQECPLNDRTGGNSVGLNLLMPNDLTPREWQSYTEQMLAEIRRRWRINPAAVRLSDALDSYLKADHNSDARKLEMDYIELLNAQRAFEKAAI